MFCKSRREFRELPGRSLVKLAIAVSTQAANALDHYISPAAVVGDSRDELTDYIRTKTFTPNTMLALRDSACRSPGWHVLQFVEHDEQLVLIGLLVIAS